MNMQEFLRAQLEEGRAIGTFPAAAAAIGAGTQVLAEAFVGEAPLPGDAPVDRNTLWDMASLSKILGPTMLALKAVEDGIWSLDTRVGDLYPEAPQDKSDITVYQLMTHTAGFVPDFWLEEECAGPDEALKAIFAHPLQGRPGEKPVYSCIGYILLGKMLETLYGGRLMDIARERVFLPLGMEDTCYCPRRRDRCAATEVDRTSGKPWIGIVHDENARFLRGNSGNAGVFMPLKDGEVFAGMLASGGGSFLKPETLKLARRNHTRGQAAHRGLGFQIAGIPDTFFGPDVPETCFGHTGFTGTSLLVEPETGFYVLLLSNRVYPSRTSEALFAFRRHLHSLAWDKFRDMGLR